MKIEYDKVRSFWDRQAEGDPEMAGMLDVLSPAGARFRGEAEWEHFLRIVGPGPEWRVLDLGCGAGRWAFRLAPRVSLVHGVDISGRMIALAEAEKARRGADNVVFFQGSILDAPAPGPYDLIYFSSVLNHLTDGDQRGLVRRLAGSLSASGRFLSRDSIAARSRKALSGDYPIIYRTLEEYVEPFRGAGFRLAYLGDSYRKPRGEGKLLKVMPAGLQRRSPGVAAAALGSLDFLARALAAIGAVRPGPEPEVRHVFMLFERE